MLYNDAIEGFIDHDGIFLTREDAYDEAEYYAEQVSTAFIATTKIK